MAGTALLDMYAKFGRMDFSTVIFDAMRVKFFFPWIAMIDLYLMHGDNDFAVKIFDEMPVRDAISGLLCLMDLLREIILRKHWSIFEKCRFLGWSRTI